jgi:hypothetical protein
MLFVDGENLTLRAQALVASMAKFSLPPGPLYREDVFVWLPRTACEHGAADLSIFHDVHLGGPPLRSIYYTSLVGDEETLQKVRTDLWTLEFQPEVFKKTARDQKAKGVDISLTKDMLSHAFLDNYDIAVLVAGDGDYVPLVQEIKRLGKRVHLCFFAGQGLNPNLKLAADHFADLTQDFMQHWILDLQARKA